MNKLNLKIAYIYVTYKETDEMKKEIRREIEELGFENLKIYHIDNLKNNIGYAAGVNQGIKLALKDNPDIFIVSNPDISLKGISKKDIIKLSEHFDIGGFAVVQDNKTYYGGEIDKWRMSGALINERPKKRFVERDFVSGSLMVVKREVIEKVGFFSEDYFLYYEEVDYCTRARKEGLRIGIDSQKKYAHFEISDQNPKKEMYLKKSRIKFLLKYGTIWQKIYELARLPKTVLEYFFANKITQSGFLVNFFSLNASSFWSKFLNFILFIFLVRYLNPIDYGVYTLVWAQITLFGPLADLGTTTYGIVHLPTEKQSKFISLFNLRFTTAVVVFVMTIFTSFVFFRSNIRIFNLIFLVSFTIFSNMFSGTYLIKNSISGKIYNSSIVSSIFNVILVLSLIIGILMTKSLSVVFILIFIFYNFYSFVNYFLINKDLKKYSYKIDLKSWIGFIKKSYIFVLISFFAGLYFKLDVFLLQFLKGSKEVGIYSAGYKFFEALILIAASYNVARTPIFAKLFKKNRNLMFKAMKIDLSLLFFLGLLISISFFFISPVVLPFFMKGNYLESIKVSKIVIFALPFILLSSVFLNALYVLNKAYLVIFIFLSQTIINFILNLTFIPKYSYFASSFITIISEAINFLLLFIIFKYESINRRRSTLHSTR